MYGRGEKERDEERRGKDGERERVNSSIADLERDIGGKVEGKLG